MDSATTAGIRMEKLNESNFHSWKQKIELVLGHREVDEMIDRRLCPDKPPDGTEEAQKWLRKDKTARMNIGLTLSDEMLENVSHTSTALEMWEEICNVHQRHTLLNKLSARRDFYTATMRSGEKMLVYINRIRQMSSVLQSMEVFIDDKELAMAVLNGLPPSYGTIITALDAIGDEDDSFTLDKIRSRLLQEEKRRSLRSSIQIPTKPAVLVQNAFESRKGNKKHCTHCGRKNHTEPYCWQKHGRPQSGSRKSFGRQASNAMPDATAAVATEHTEVTNSDAIESEYVCLMTNQSPKDSHEGLSSIVWYIDSGASNHMTFARSAFCSYSRVEPFPVQMGDKSTTTVVGRGDVLVPIICDGAKKTCKLIDVLHVPDLQFSLVSVSTLAERGICTNFSTTRVHILKDNKVLATGTRSKGLYALDSPSSGAVPVLCVASLQLWHERMGHVHHAGLQQMARKGIVKGLEIFNSKTHLPKCEGCVMGKMPRTAFPKSSQSRAVGILDLVHSDIAGPLPVSSKGGARYFVTFIDDKSRWVTVYPIKVKSDCFASFKLFQTFAERRTGKKIKTLRSDGGGEYTSTMFKSYLERNGIHQQFTVAHTPQQNGIAERMNRTLKDLLRAMMLHKNVPQEFWADAIVTAAYIRNRMTSRGLPSYTTPYALWCGEKPDVSHLRVFGSKCWYKVNGPGPRSLDSRSSEALMIGYSPNQKGYKLWDTTKGDVVVSRDVIFDERPSTDAILADYEAPDQGGEPDEDTSPDFNPTSDNSHDSMHSAETPSEASAQSPPMTQNVSTEISEPPRSSNRTRKKPGEWWITSALLTTAPEITLSFTTATKGEDSKHWLPAIQSEIYSIRKNRTWSLVPRSEARNILTSKWVFKRKDAQRDDGSHYLKYKARIVTRGFQQKEGIDFTETFAPVVRFTTLRMLFALVASMDLECHQMDVKTAFLNGELEQDVYMEQPQGFEDKNHRDHVCKLHKALYGLKQAPRQWFSKIDSFLTTELNFTSSAYDPCLYVRKEKHSIVLVSLYVDDLLLASNSLKELVSLKNSFSRKFEMTDCGEANVVLGLEIRRDRSRKNLHLSQTRYTNKILERFNMLDCKSVVTPMEHQITPNDLTGNPIDSTLYRQCIGSLMYLSVGTRPDISFAVSRLAQFVESPTQHLWTAAKRVLRYIAGTRTLGIVYDGISHLAPTGYSDSDWGGCKINRKSTSGFAFVMSGGAVSWKSKKQGCVAQSSAEAEYMALSAAAKESIWLKSMFNFTQNKHAPQPVKILCDNQGAIKMARNDSSGTRTKHIDIQYHFVRDSLAKNLFSIDYCSTTDMTADILTKPLSRTLLEKHKKCLGLEKQYIFDGIGLRGSVEDK